MSHFKKLFESTKTIAVVGLSNNPERASYRVSAYMLSQGYQIIPVNPFADEILEQKVFAQLSEIPFKIDLVNVFRTAKDCPAITQDSVAIGAKSIWIQLGIISPESELIARNAGLEFVMDRCLKIEHQQL
jgi:predicted CoA-binding protein